MVYLVTGGSGSGKSEYAEGLVMESPCKQRFYVATMAVYGAEGRAKVTRHQMLRRGKGFITLECQTHVGQALSGKGAAGDAVVLLECVSNLAANEMFGPENNSPGNNSPGNNSPGNNSPDIDSLACRLADDIRFLASQVKDMVIVTNEVASDGILYDSETMEYIRLMGLLNKKLAEMADRVVEVVYGIPVNWK